MGNYTSIDPEVEGWVILKEGDDVFDAELNDNKPYYYNLRNNEIWRRNLFGWGPPSANI
jgi:hypothetical protein